MARLRDIMTRDVMSVAPDLSIRDAMNVLSSRHISGAPVVAGSEIVGVITSTDLMAFAAELTDVSVEDDEKAVEELPTRDRRRDMESDPDATFFTGMWEDAGADSVARFANTPGRGMGMLDVHTVEEAMTRTPIYSVASDSSPPAAAEFMRSHGIHRVFVTEKGKFVGLVTSTDIANAVASHKLRESKYVFGKEAHFTGKPGGKLPHPEARLGARLPGAKGAKSRGRSKGRGK